MWRYVRPRVVIATPDFRLAQSMRGVLERAIDHLEVETVDTVLAAIDAIVRQGCDVIVLDQYMPDLSLEQSCATLRGFDDTAIIALVDPQTLERVASGEADLDDCISRPPLPAELVFRVGMQLRRRQLGGSDEAHLGDLVVDFGRGIVRRYGNETKLTKTEYRLLRALARTPGRVVETAQLLSDVWGSVGDHDESVVRLYVSRLRRKLGDSPAQPQFVKSLPGIGYYIVQPDNWQDPSVVSTIARRRRTERRVYAQVAQALVEEDSIERVGRIVIEQVIDALDATAACFFLLDEAKQSLSLVVSQGYAEGVVEVIRSLDFGVDTPATLAAKTGRIAILPGESEEQQFSFIRDVVFPIQRLEWLIALPLKIHDRVLGVVTYSTTTRRRYDDDDLDFLSTIANLFAAAVENAQLRAQRLSSSQSPIEID